MTDTTAAPLEGTAPIKLSRKDFASDQEVRWCPGCGDYSILAQTQKIMPDFGYPRENIVFISGIGCSGRLPYYMNTYGFHSIHGRAPTLATGLKAARPDLMVWVITGDGDALSIGGNHIIHSMRRNVDIKVVMFNNRIYGLTKGQASPTSEFGKRTKSTPQGTIDQPVVPLSVALTAEATLIARSVDTYTEHLQETLDAAGFHKGSAFVEVLQNCNIFNDGAWREFTDKDVREDRMLKLRHGDPMIFGKDSDKGIRMVGLRPEVVQLGGGVTEADLTRHDEEDPTLAYVLSRMWWPEYPVPVGVLRRVSRPTHDQLVTAQVDDARAQKGEGDLRTLLFAGEHLDGHLSASIVVVADDLIWASRIVEAVSRAGGSAQALSSEAQLGVALQAEQEGERPLVGGAVVDLGSRRMDGIEAVRLVAAARLPVIAVARHDDQLTRRRALDAGAMRVFSYDKFFRDGPALVATWLTDR